MKCSQPHAQLPWTLQDVTVAIRNVCEDLDQDMIQRTFNEMVNCVRRCIDVNGGFLNDKNLYHCLLFPPRKS